MTSPRYKRKRPTNEESLNLPFRIVGYRVELDKASKDTGILLPFVLPIGSDRLNQYPVR
jgi:hypothetical protein